MLTSVNLGQALKEAMSLKKVTQATVAKEFGVAQPSVSEWTRYGRIGKEHLNHLVRYFSDVVGPAHWGLDLADGDSPQESAPAAERGIFLAKPMTVGHLLQAVSRVTRSIPDENRQAIQALASAAEISDANAAVIDTLSQGATVSLPADVAAAADQPDYWGTALSMAETWPEADLRPYLQEFIAAVEQAARDKAHARAHVQGGAKTTVR